MPFETSMDISDTIEHTLTYAKPHSLTTYKADKLNKESWELGRIDPSKSLSSALEAERISSELCYTGGMALSNLNQGWYYCSKAEFRQSELLFHKAIMQFEEINDYDGILKGYAGISGIYYYLGHYETVLKYTEKSLSIASETSNVNRQISTLILNAQTYLQLEEYDTALQHSITAENLIETLDSYDQYDVLYQTIGRVYLALEEFTYARDYFSRALEILETSKKFFNAPETLCLIAQTYDFKKDRNTIEKYLLDALALPHNNEESVIIFYYLAQFYYKDNQYDKAIPFAKKCIQDCKKTGVLKFLEKANEIFYKMV